MRSGEKWTATVCGLAGLSNTASTSATTPSHSSISSSPRLREDRRGRLRQHGVRERLTLDCRDARPIAFQTTLVSSARRRIKARVDGKPVSFTHYRKAPGWVSPLERGVGDLRREKVPPGSISVLLTNKPSGDEQKALQRLGLVQLTEEHVAALGTETRASRQGPMLRLRLPGPSRLRRSRLSMPRGRCRLPPQAPQRQPMDW